MDPSLPLRLLTEVDQLQLVGNVLLLQGKKNPLAKGTFSYDLNSDHSKQPSSDEPNRRRESKQEQMKREK